MAGEAAGALDVAGSGCGWARAGAARIVGVGSGSGSDPVLARLEPEFFSGSLLAVLPLPFDFLPLDLLLALLDPEPLERPVLLGEELPELSPPPLITTAQPELTNSPHSAKTVEVRRRRLV